MSTNSASTTRLKRMPLLAAVIATLIYFGVALGLLHTCFGPEGWLVSKERLTTGYWIGRVLSSPINLFSLIAFGVAVGLLWERRTAVRAEQEAFELDIVRYEEETLILPEDAITCRKRLHDLDDKQRSFLLIELLSFGLQRARANWSAEDVGTAISMQADLKRDEQEAEYSMIRYLAWAIPSIGFVGTVLGIGQAMGSIKPTQVTTAETGGSTQAVSPLMEAASHLNTAFDTTFVALVLSLILMFVLHRIQAAEDALLTRATDACLRQLPLRMHVTKEANP